jgi:branched-chain amino acid transport system permease protein
MMVGALGVNIARLNTLLFVLGAVLAGLAGLMAGPILSAQTGMGEPVLILAFVVIVIGGIGSIKGALIGAVIVGVVDTMGRFLLPALLSLFLAPAAAASTGAALASMLIYIVMALVLAVRPQGLFPADS